jgi:signal transduction histidine kinase/DNA-binding response OmpR family regulator
VILTRRWTCARAADAVTIRRAATPAPRQERPGMSTETRTPSGEVLPAGTGVIGSAAAQPRILVVDDDPDVARTLMDLLALHGFGSSRADSGEQALERLRDEAFDLVMLDVRLPGMSGFEACARVREAHGPSLPVIMLTAFGDAAAMRQSHLAGADDFLHKPVDSGALLLKVRALLRFKALHDELVRAREQAQVRARDLALLHEIGRDWSLIAEPADFHRMVTQRLALLIGAPVCLIALYDAATRTLGAALPAHGLPDERARQLRYAIKPEYRALWNFRTGRPYLSNRARTDPRLIPEMVQLAEAESAVLVPMISEGVVLGLLVALNKPGGFTDADVQILSIFAGPAAGFLRSRELFGHQRRHAERLERASALVGEMAATAGRTALLGLTVGRIQKDFGYDHVAFYARVAGNGLAPECEAGSARALELPADAELLKWASRATTPMQAARGASAELAVPVRAGDKLLGVLAVLRGAAGSFGDDEVNLLSTLAGQLAVALQKSAGVRETERLAAQMATLYDLGLETLALRDLRPLFVKATEEAGRLIKADATSVFRLYENEGELRVFAGWAQTPGPRAAVYPVIRLGEGIASRVVRERVPLMLNEPERHPEFVRWDKPVGRLLCVPLTYYDQEREGPVIFGVLNATRVPGGPAFTNDDLEYVTRFAGQLSIAVANSMAFSAERERSDQLALVNALIREIAGNLSRERILETAVRRIQEAFSYPVVMILVPDYETGVLRTAAAATAQHEVVTSSDFPIHSGVTGRALKEKRTVLVPDAAQDPDYVRQFAGTRSEVAIPIVSGDDVVAVLNVESHALRAFDRGQVITLETLADGLGIILRNAELYEALERTNAKLVELDRMKSELVNIVAHDFRAPLAGVLGYAELLEWKPDAARADRIEQARAIIQAATHMANLVDKTLKTTRLETGHFPFDFGLVDLAATLRDVVGRLPENPKYPVSTSIPDDPVPAWADADRVCEVLDNLLSNAIKYSPDGGPLRVELVTEGETAIVRVIDRGIGIEQRDIARLFRPFSRVRDRRTAEIEGSGLGLYICDRITRAHGGRLWVESVPDQGSTFSVALPLFGVSAQTRAPLVLVAAGDEGTRREVRRVAEALGYGTHEVSDGVDAVEASARLVPAAVILDRVLPRLRAEEIAERLKENIATQSVPLFVLASEDDLGDKGALFTACVPKPLDRSLLAAALDAVSRGAALS